MTKELEVKVLNIDVDRMQEKIISLGGKLVAIEKQINTLLDNLEKPIKSYLDAYLRIREMEEEISGKKEITLTLKEKILNESLRENIEYNVTLEEKDNILNIFGKLGFKVVDVGFKDRRSYSFKKARIDIDIWDDKTYPFPYMEIEVEQEDDLEEIITLLDIPRENISRLSIVELQQKLKEGKDVK